MGGDGVKGVDWDIVILASCEYYFIRVHENLAHQPSNNRSISNKENKCNIKTTFLMIENHTLNDVYIGRDRIPTSLWRTRPC